MTEDINIDLDITFTVRVPAEYLEAHVRILRGDLNDRITHQTGGVPRDCVRVSRLSITVVDLRIGRYMCGDHNDFVISRREGGGGFDVFRSECGATSRNVEYLGHRGAHAQFRGGDRSCVDVLLDPQPVRHDVTRSPWITVEPVVPTIMTHEGNVLREGDGIGLGEVPQVSGRFAQGSHVSLHTREPAIVEIVVTTHEIDRFVHHPVESGEVRREGACEGDVARDENSVGRGPVEELSEACHVHTGLERIVDEIEVDVSEPDEIHVSFRVARPS